MKEDFAEVQMGDNSDRVTGEKTRTDRTVNDRPAKDLGPQPLQIRKQQGWKDSHPQQQMG